MVVTKRERTNEMSEEEQARIFTNRDLLIASIPAIAISIISWVYQTRGAFYIPLLSDISASMIGLIAFLGFLIWAKLSRMGK